MITKICVTMTMLIAAAFVLVATSNPSAVRIQDQCDPASFNLAVGPGTCTGSGQTTFDHFIAYDPFSNRRPGSVLSPAGDAAAGDGRAGQPRNAADPVGSRTTTGRRR